MLRPPRNIHEYPNIGLNLYNKTELCCIISIIVSILFIGFIEIILAFIWYEYRDDHTITIAMIFSILGVLICCSVCIVCLLKLAKNRFQNNIPNV